MTETKAPVDTSTITVRNPADGTAESVNLFEAPFSGIY